LAVFLEFSDTSIEGLMLTLLNKQKHIMSNSVFSSQDSKTWAIWEFLLQRGSVKSNFACFR